MCQLEFKMLLPPAKKQKTPACIREVQVHKLWPKFTPKKDWQLCPLHIAPILRFEGLHRQKNAIYIKYYLKQKQHPKKVSALCCWDLVQGFSMLVFTHNQMLTVHFFLLPLSNHDWMKHDVTLTELLHFIFFLMLCFSECWRIHKTWYVEADLSHLPLDRIAYMMSQCFYICIQTYQRERRGNFHQNRIKKQKYFFHTIFSLKFFMTMYSFPLLLPILLHVKLLIL